MLRRIFAVLVSAAIGVLLSAVAWAVWPHRYASSAVVAYRFAAPHDAADEQKVRAFFDGVRSTAWSDRELESIAQKRSLTFEAMKPNVKISELKNSAAALSRDAMCCWEISFIAADPAIPPHVVLDLEIALIGYARFNPAISSRCPPETDCRTSGVEVIQPHSPGNDLHPRAWQFGLIGALGGALAALVSLRRWHPPLQA